MNRRLFIEILVVAALLYAGSLFFSHLNYEDERTINVDPGVVIRNPDVR